MKNLSIEKDCVNILIEVEYSDQSYAHLQIGSRIISEEYVDVCTTDRCEYENLDMCTCRENDWPYAFFGGQHDDSCIGICPTAIFARVPLFDFHEWLTVRYHYNVNGKKFNFYGTGSQFLELVTAEDAAYREDQEIEQRIADRESCEE